MAQSGSVPISLDDDEADATADGQLLSHLVGDVSEVSLDESSLRSVYDIHVTGRRSKGSNSKKANRKGSKNSKFSK